MKPTLLLALIVAASACNRVKPHLSPYDGLVPRNYAIPVSANQFDPSAIGDKTVAIVTTANFEAFSKMWMDYFERGGAERARSTMSSAMSAVGRSDIGAMAAGVAASGEQYSRKTSDPRRITDEVARQLQRHFGKVIVAADFPEAIDQKAHYIALVDFHTTGNRMGDNILVWNGFYLHDASFNQLFKFENSFKSHRSMGDISGAKAYDNAMTTTVTTFRQELTQRLTPRTAPR